MRDKGRMETEDIILGKAKYEDWRSIYRNVWSRPEPCDNTCVRGLKTCQKCSESIEDTFEGLKPYMYHHYLSEEDN